MQRLKKYIQTKFQKRPVKLESADLSAQQKKIYDCMKISQCDTSADNFNDTCYFQCKNQILQDAGILDEDDETLEYIILFVIIGLVCYGGYKYFKK